MRKTILTTFILSFLIFDGLAQSEEYKTAKWRYYLHAIDFQQTWNEEMTYTKDTSFYGETWQQFNIERKVQQYPNGAYLFSETRNKFMQWVGDKVYYLPQGDSVKYLLFDFDASIGDSWNYKRTYNTGGGCPDSNQYQVNAKGVDTINGVPVKWIKGINVNPYSSDILDTGKIYQNIGMPISLFEPFYNPACITHPPVYALSCYTNTTIGQYSLDSTRCNLYGTLRIETETKQEQFSVYPNPADIAFSIRSINGISKIALVDFKGRLVLEKDIDDSIEYHLSLTDFQSGLYALFVNNQFVQRVVIQH